MKRVFICSPFRSTGLAQRRLHEAWLRLLCARALAQGHAPFAPHGFYPRMLDDTDPEQRAAGIGAGMAWLEASDEVWALRSPVTEGMRAEIARAEELCLPVFYWDVATLEALANPSKELSPRTWRRAATTASQA